LLRILLIKDKLFIENQQNFLGVFDFTERNRKKRKTQKPINEFGLKLI
jgi:hypothetical protein